MMKRLIAIFAYFTVFASCSVAYAQAPLVFKVMEQELPTIEEGKLADATFSFTNQSDTTLVLTNVVSSCGCTVAAWSKEAIAPQQNGEIKVSYNSNNRPGYYVRTIKVQHSASKDPILLKIKGYVKPKTQ